MWWPWRWTTQTSFQKTTCFGECINPWGHTIVFRKGLISWVPSQRLSTAGGSELAMAAQGQTSALSRLYPQSQHQPGLEFLRTTLQSKALPTQSSSLAPLLHVVRLALEPPPLSCSFHIF